MFPKRYLRISYILWTLIFIYTYFSSENNISLFTHIGKDLHEGKVKNKLAYVDTNLHVKSWSSQYVTTLSSQNTELDNHKKVDFYCTRTPICVNRARTNETLNNIIK